MVKEIKDSNFEELVEKNKGVCLVDCFAVWCVPCKMLSPVLEDLSNEMTEVSFFKVDVDQNPQVSNALEIQYMPHAGVVASMSAQWVASSRAP